MNLKMNNCFCNYVLTIKQLKDRFLWRGVKTPLVDTHLKSKKLRGSSQRAAFFWGGGRRGKALLKELCPTNS